MSVIMYSSAANDRNLIFLTFLLISTVMKCFCNSGIQSYLFTPAVLAFSGHPPLSVMWKPPIWRERRVSFSFILKFSHLSAGLLTAVFRLGEVGPLSFTKLISPTPGDASAALETPRLLHYSVYSGTTLQHKCFDAKQCASWLLKWWC